MNIITFFKRLPYLKITGLYLLSILSLIPCVFIIKNQIIPIIPWAINLVTFVKFLVGFIFLYLLCKVKGIVYFLNNWKLNKRQILVMVIFLVPQLTVVFFRSDFIFSWNSFWYLLHHFSTGFSEEILHRGIFLIGFTYFYIHSGNKNPVLWAILFTGIFFGWSHFINVLTTDQTLIQSILQCTSAMLYGFAFCILTIITRNIWLSIALHWFNNTYNLFTIAYFGIQLELEYLMAIFCCFSVFLLDKKSIENWKEKIKMLFIK